MESVIRGAAIYLLVLVVIRVSGRRTLGNMTPFDFVLLLIVAETTQQALLGEDLSMTNALLVLLTLFGIDIALSHIKQRWPRAENWIDGQPTVLISLGQPDWRALQRSRVELDDVMEAARAHGLERLDQVKFAVLETGGSISIVPEPHDGGSGPEFQSGGTPAASRGPRRQR
jgi:uncharacterized membrane protein YcaP (DUF421 family)